MDILQLNMFDGKACTKCKEWKPYNQFAKNKNLADGVGVWCKSCMNRYAHNYVQNNQDILYQKKKEHYAKNSERIKAQVQGYRDTHGDEHRGRSRNYYARHKKERNKYSQLWNQRNPDKRKTSHENRRARKLNSVGAFTAKQWRALCSWFKDICLVCDAHTKLTPDHVIPLSRGGSNDISNIQPLCLTCNLRKQTKTIDYRDPDRLAAFLEIHYDSDAQLPQAPGDRQRLRA